jgi:hypothetical protein
LSNDEKMLRVVRAPSCCSIHVLNKDSKLTRPSDKHVTVGDCWY